MDAKQNASNALSHGAHVGNRGSNLVSVIFISSNTSLCKFPVVLYNNCIIKGVNAQKYIKITMNSLFTNVTIKTNVQH